MTRFRVMKSNLLPRGLHGFELGDLFGCFGGQSILGVLIHHVLIGFKGLFNEFLLSHALGTGDANVRASSRFEPGNRLPPVSYTHLTLPTKA